MIRKKFDPLGYTLFSILNSKRTCLALSFILIVIWRVLSVYHGFGLRSALHQRGFHELSLLDAQILLLALGKVARKLPHRDEVEMVLGVNPIDLNSLIDLMKLQQRNKNS